MEEISSNFRNKYTASIEKNANVENEYQEPRIKPKQPYLKRGSGMRRYNMTQNDIGKDNKNKITWKKHKPKKSDKLTTESNLENKNREDKNLNNYELVPKANDILEINLADHIKELLNNLKLSTQHRNEENVESNRDEENNQVLKSEHSMNYNEDTEDSTCLSPSLMQALMNKELAEDKLFEALERKIQDDSFSSQSSFFCKMTGNNTPSINRQYVQAYPEIIHLQPHANALQNTESTISTENNPTVESNEIKDETDDDEEYSESSSTETEETCHLAINKDMHTSTPNQKPNKIENSPKKNVIKIIVKDDSTMNSTLTDGMHEHQNDIAEKTELLKTRLRELEMQMEIFKRENENLTMLRSEMEQERDEFLKSKASIEKKLNEERILMEYQLANEKEKLAKQKTLYDRHVKEMKNGSQKKERGEILTLKSEISKLKEQITTKDARNGAMQARLRTQIKNLEKENNDLKDKCDQMKKECNKLKGLNSRSRKLSNLRALAEINKSLAEFTLRNNMTNKNAIDNEHIIDKNKNIRKRTRSEPNLRASSHYTKFFSDRDREDREKKISMYQNESSSSSDEEIIQDHIDEPKQYYKAHKQHIPLCLKQHEHDSKSVENESPKPMKLSLPIQNSSIEKIYKEKFKNSSVLREANLPNGSREIHFANGNKKIISKCGNHEKFIYYNGDIKETFHDEGTIKYYHKQSKTHRTSYKDGSEVLHYPDGSMERRYKDGSTVTQIADDCTRYVAANGSEEWSYPDGSVVCLTENKEQIIRFPNGQVEIHGADHKRREYPDGTVKYLYNDGVTETRYSNGRIRVKDKDGNLILDSRPQKP